MKKALKVISYVIPIIVVLVLGFVGIRYFDEIRTLISVKLIEGTNLYTMEYFSDYHFDDFLKTGASDNNEYYDYVNSIMDGKINIGIHKNTADDACSAFTFRDKNGNRYMARNYDYTANPVMLLVTSPDDAYKSISAVNMNCMGYNNETTPKNFDLRTFAAPYFPTDGVNEKGISISMLQVNFSRKQKEEGKSTLSAYAVIRLVLDYADSIDKAVELMDKYNIYFDSGMMVHFFIADAEGKSALIEFVDGQMHIVENEGSFQIASNFNNTEERFDAEGYVYSRQYREWLTNATTSAYDSEYSPYVRYDYMLDSLYNNSGIMTIDDSFKILENVASPEKLQYSVVYNLNTLEATIITDNDWDKKTTVALSHKG